MFKNVAGQKLTVFAFDATTNLPKTGDAANITAYVSKDFGAVTVLGDTTATEIDATNAKGYYIFDLTQAETNGDTLTFSAKSSTANIVVIAVPATVYTLPPNFTTLSISATGKTTDAVQTGDAFARIGANGAGLTAIFTSSDRTLLTNTNTRVLLSLPAFAPSSPSGLVAFDGSGNITGNLNGDVYGKILGAGASAISGIGVRAVDSAGNPLATVDDINALNQSASRRIILVTSPQYERPESGNNTYQIEARTYDPDGASINADGTPTLTATGLVSGSLAGNLSAATNPSTGVYRWTYTVASTAVLQQVRFDVSALISASTFTLSTFTQVADFVAATWTTADRTLLTDTNTRVLLALPAVAPANPDGLMILGSNNVNPIELIAGTGQPSIRLLNDSFGFMEGNIVGDIQGTIDGVSVVTGNVNGKVLGGGVGVIGGLGVWASGTTGATLPAPNSGIAASVWDLLTAGHTTVGTFGAAMSAAGSSGDPWITNLPGSYVTGQAGNILGTLAGGGGGATAGEIVDAIKSFEVETGHSFLQVMQYMAAFIIGLTTRDVGNSTLAFRNLLNTFDRIKFKLDIDNNRVESTVNQS